jgi:hypothetical protein
MPNPAAVPAMPPPVVPVPPVSMILNPGSSMLDQVLTSAASAPAAGGEVPGVPPVVIKRKVVTPAQILRIMGALLFVSLIFFGSFLAYIVFNPEQAKFFIGFGIKLSDVKTLLSNLVNGIFGTLTFSFSTLFIFCLFKVYLSRGNLKKRAIYIVSSVFVGIVLFSNIGFWAFLFEKIGAQDFVRPYGGVIIYDNTLLLSSKYTKVADQIDLNNLIGPITLKYDLSSDVKYASKTLDVE